MTFFLMVVAALLTWFLQYRYYRNNFIASVNFILEKKEVFLFSSLLMFIILSFFTGLTRRPIIAAGIVWGLIIVVTYIHISKYEMRGTPLLPEDFMLAEQATTLTNFVDIWSIVRLILALILVAGLTFLVNWWVVKRFRLKEQDKPKHWIKRHAIVSRSLIVIMSIISFLVLTDFVRHNSGQRYEAVAWLGTSFTAWNQTSNYNDNGFLLGFLYNLEKLEVEAPSGYNKDKMSEIKTLYATLAETGNKTRTSIAEDAVSVVVVLNESFYDATVTFGGEAMEDYYPFSGGDILPNLHRIQNDFPSGYMYSIDYGGGTANVEFEAFTGLTNYWINSVPYTSLVPKAGKIVSVANYLGSAGYQTTAIHPYNGGMYKRNISLPNLGFNDFITELEISYTDKDGGSQYINDDSAYRQVLDILNSTDENQLIGLITMQNHVPYGEVHDESEREFESLATELTEDQISSLEDSYEILHKSDEYLGRFLDQLDDLDKKVVVLFFGDHVTGPYDELNSSDDRSVGALSRLTPYFIYYNFDYDKTDLELPTTTPNCLSNTLFNYFNWQKPDYFYLLDEVCAEEPILTQKWFGKDEAPFQSTAISSYELLTYDILGGEKYWMSE